MRILKLIFVSAVLALTASCAVAQTNDASKIYGDWTGDSICVNKEKFPACKDEKVVYHFSKSSADASKIHIVADKIVDGKNEFMGEFDLDYNAASKTLSAEMTTNKYRMIWEFKINGNTIEGTLKDLPDKTLIREIKVKKTE